MTEKKTILITGASSGFGKLTAKKFQKEGWNVIATMRTPEKEEELNKLDNVLVIKLDVTDKETINSAIKEGIDKLGQIDVLLNNAGYGAMGVMEAATEDQIKREFDVNLFGVLNVTRAVLPSMRENKSGTIINISSIGGRIAFPYMSLYHATKFAIEGLSESLQYELEQFGIKMKIVEPGAYRTDFGTRSLDLFDVNNVSDYKENFESFMNGVQSMMDNAADPQEVADIIFEAATDENEQLRYPVGKDAISLLELKHNSTDLEFKNKLKEQFGF